MLHLLFHKKWGGEALSDLAARTVNWSPSIVIHSWDKYFWREENQVRDWGIGVSGAYSRVNNVVNRWDVEVRASSIDWEDFKGTKWEQSVKVMPTLCLSENP